MPGSPTRRPPESADIARVLAELARHGVEYALLGGAAMALHGYPRMTKDIDLLLPRSARNNGRLLKALEALRPVLSLDHIPDKKTLDAGYSTSAEGELGIDLLFVAASRSFDDYRRYIVTRELDGVPVRMLDIDGMLLSKETGRPEDIPDLQRLRRLKGPAGGRGGPPRRSDDRLARYLELQARIDADRGVSGKPLAPISREELYTGVLAERGLLRK